MPTAWGIARLVALSCVCGVADRPGRPDACIVAAEQGAWDDAIEACDRRIASGAGDLDDRGRALQARYGLQQWDAVLRDAPALYDTRVGADALHWSGWVVARREGELDLLWRALGSYLVAGRWGEASITSSELSQAATDRSDFDRAIALAQRGERVARTDRQREYAFLAKAAAFDGAGFDQDARAAMVKAEDLAPRGSSERTWAYLTHALMFLDRYTPNETALALAYLDDAAANLGAPERDLPAAISIALNRAVALAALGRDGEAAAAQAAALQLDPTLVGDTMYVYVLGILAAHRGDTATAERRLGAAITAGLLPDYAIAADVELAGLYRRAGRDADAERVLRAAIELVDGVRAGGGRELRSWILAHRARPYHALLALLAGAGRGADALAVMEALHARVWLDNAGGAAASAPSAAELIARAGGREVLVFIEAGPTVWRAHVAGGAVTVEPIADGAEALAALAAAPDDPAAAARAGAALIPAAVAASDQPLYIVAAGRLAAVPFPALRRGARALIDDRPIARVPGVVAMACRAHHAPEVAAVVIGDAAENLPAAADEARAVAAQLGVTAQLGDAATIAAVIAGRHAALLHLAVHAAMSQAGGALVLADGALDAAAIRANQIAPDVVILAGCHTGTSRDAETWGALSSAFLAAGAGFVVATTRTVDDNVTHAVVRAYFDADRDPIHRLAAAQRGLAARLPPSAWASFAAWGVLGCD